MDLSNGSIIKTIVEKLIAMCIKWLIFPWWRVWHLLHSSGGVGVHLSSQSAQFCFPVFAEPLPESFCDTGEKHDVNYCLSAELGHFHILVMMERIASVLSNGHRKDMQLFSSTTSHLHHWTDWIYTYSRQNSTPAEAGLFGGYISTLDFECAIVSTAWT